MHTECRDLKCLNTTRIIEIRQFHKSIQPSTKGVAEKSQENYKQCSQASTIRIDSSDIYKKSSEFSCSCLRYLSCLSQISISYKLDITANYVLYVFVVSRFHQTLFYYINYLHRHSLTMPTEQLDTGEAFMLDNKHLMLFHFLLQKYRSDFLTIIFVSEVFSPLFYRACIYLDFIHS